MSMVACTCNSNQGGECGHAESVPCKQPLESGKTQEIEAGFYPSGPVLRECVLTR